MPGISPDGAHGVVLWFAGLGAFARMALSRGLGECPLCPGSTQYSALCTQHSATSSSNSTRSNSTRSGILTALLHALAKAEIIYALRPSATINSGLRPGVAAFGQVYALYFLRPSARCCGWRVGTNLQYRLIERAVAIVNYSKLSYSI